MARRRGLKKILLDAGVYDGGTPLSFDIIGDILILKSPVWISGLDVKHLIPVGEKIVEILPYIKSVWLSYSPVEGEFRLRRLIHIAGEKRTVTLYREHGAVFKVDVSKAYISPRLSYEHQRLSRVVGGRETVVNMFSGVGGFTIPIAMRARPSMVYSIELNPYAYSLLVENISLNRVDDRVKAILGDAREIIPKKISRVADRVLMPLSGLDESHYKAALMALRAEKGFIHVYDFVFSDKGERGAVCSLFEEASSIIKRLGWIPRLTYGRVVRSVGPRKYQVVLDLEVVRKKP